MTRKSCEVVGFKLVKFQHLLDTTMALNAIGIYVVHRHLNNDFSFTLYFTI